MTGRSVFRDQCADEDIGIKDDLHEPMPPLRQQVVPLLANRDQRYVSLSRERSREISFTHSLIYEFGEIALLAAIAGDVRTDHAVRLVWYD